MCPFKASYSYKKLNFALDDNAVNFFIIKNMLQLWMFYFSILILCQKYNIFSSYQERWRDWPDESSAAELLSYCAKSSKRCS